MSGFFLLCGESDPMRVIGTPAIRAGIRIFAGALNSSS
jgi:hypothetical protein